MKRVCFLVDSWFFGEHSGIYTFIKHYARMVDEMDGIWLDIITDYEVEEKFRKDPVFKNVAFSSNMVTDKSKQGITEDAIKAYSIKLDDYLSDNAVRRDCVAIIAHSFTSTTAMAKFSHTDDIKFMSYTHIGDILDPALDSLYDFSSELVVKQLKLLAEHPEIAIGTQNNGVVFRLETMLERKNIHTLPEPFYYGNVKPGNPDGPILILSSNYRRKQLERMMKTIAALDKEVLIIAGRWEEESCMLIDDMILNYKVKRATVLREIPNKHIRRHIEKCSMMFHFSSIEVMPYAVMESMLSLPVIIDANATWAKAFPFHTPVRVDTTDIAEVASAIANINPATLVPFAQQEIADYAKDALAQWAAYLDYQPQVK